MLHRKPTGISCCWTQEIHRGKFTPQPVKANRSDANKTFRIPLRLADDHAAAWDAAAAKCRLSRSRMDSLVLHRQPTRRRSQGIVRSQRQGRPKTTGE